VTSETARGLSSLEAARRRAEVGDNEPAPARGRSIFLELLQSFANPLVILLLVATVVSAAVGQLVDAAIVLVIVVVGTTIGFTQTYRSRRATERLREGVAVTATILRDGSFRELPRREVVPGDVVRLTAGDLVPADGHVLEERDLHVQEAALTGESMPCEKLVGGPVFLGTSVVSGVATVEVTAIGTSTAFGKIATRLMMKAPETEFDRGLRQFGMLVTKVVFFLVLVIVVLRLALHANPMQSLLFAVALAVGLTPEFLPMVASVTLARGAKRMAAQKVIVKHLSAIQNLGAIDVLCSDKTGTLTTGDLELTATIDPLGAESLRVQLLAYLNSSLQTGVHNPLDRAILSRPHPGASGYRKLDEVPFDFQRRRVSVMVERDGLVTLVTKGAPEGILVQCTAIELDGVIRPLDDETREKAQALCDRHQERGERVIAVAFRTLEHAPATCTAVDERALVLCGFLAFTDPPRDDTATALGVLARDGVRVIVITGDTEVVTREVCGKVGLDVRDVVLGEQVELMTDIALGHVAERVNVFARMSPVQKNRVILALKQRSHVVGYLGDGINDAPSLHSADVGISVSNAADVAREAADVILLDRNLGVLHTGILEGRRAMANVDKYLLMGTSSNFGNMFSMAGASLFLPFLPMLPTQILLNNLLYDVAQITIPTDDVDPERLRRPQRWEIRRIRNFMLLIGPVSSLFDFLTFYFLLRQFHAGEIAFHTGWFVESLCTQTLVLFVIRTLGSALRSRPSRPLTMTVLAVVALAVAIPFTPIAKPLGFAPLPGPFFAFLVIVTTAYLLCVELVKERILGPR
jgi:Mg2+-importing ATPase